jgi:tRNA A37 threonylcarbamoyladenosine modification protein TsaB
MKLNQAFFFLTLITLATVPVFAEQKAQKQANCELRLVSSAGAGEIFMSIFTRNEEECLSKSDQAVEAKFRKSGNVVAKRGGAGPQP